MHDLTPLSAKNAKKYNIAVIGATGSVGSQTLEILAERNFPISNIYAVASERSIGKEVSFGNTTLKTINIESFSFHNIDIAFFSAGSIVAKQYAPLATKAGCIVIDKSSLFRLEHNIPLIIPEVNPNTLLGYAKHSIIANPNCCVIPIAIVLKCLDNEVKIKRVVISTYQSVSGAGKAGMDELYNQTKSKFVFGQCEASVFPKQIAFNLFPQIGEFNNDGSTTEEQKIKLELQKILESDLAISITCVRVPVFVGHSASINLEFHSNMNATKACAALQQTNNSIVLLSNNSQEKYVTPIDVVGEDAVYVSRVRDDQGLKNSINLWVTTDNLRKGAALNAVQIAELLVNKYLPQS